MSEKIIKVEHLQQFFPAGGFGKNKKYVRAVDDVSFYIEKGETLGLVGESAAERLPQEDHCSDSMSLQTVELSIMTRYFLTAERCRL